MNLGKIVKTFVKEIGGEYNIINFVKMREFLKKICEYSKKYW